MYIKSYFFVLLKFRNKNNVLQATPEMMGQILENDEKLKTMILDLYDSVLTMIKSKSFEKVIDSETLMYLATIENYRKQLERKQYRIVVAGKINK